MLTADSIICKFIALRICNLFLRRIMACGKRYTWAHFIDLQLAIGFIEVPPCYHSEKVRSNPRPRFVVQTFVMREWISNATYIYTFLALPFFHDTIIIFNHNLHYVCKTSHLGTCSTFSVMIAVINQDRIRIEIVMIPANRRNLSNICLINCTAFFDEKPIGSRIRYLAPIIRILIPMI